jgi:hypothetical protein
MGKVIINKPDKLVSLRSITMARGTPEQDLDTYMDNQDQQEAELNQEQREAEDTAWSIHEFIDSAPRLLSANHTDDIEIIHRTDEHVLTINILMTEVESEEFKEYIRNYGSKFVLQNYWEEKD